MSGFIDDLINMTQVQFFLKYWWLWLAHFAIAAIFIILDKGESEMSKKRKAKKSEEYKPVRVGTDKGNIFLRPLSGEEVRITDESQLNRLEKKILLLESEIKYLHELLNCKVNQDQVISAINISQENDRINGNKIHVTGETLIEDKALERKGLSTHFEKEFVETVKQAGQIIDQQIKERRQSL